MKIYIRADASTEIGYGHVMRCLALAEELKQRNADVYFVCNKFNGNLNFLIKQKGFEVHILMHRTGIDWKSDAEQTREILKKERAGAADWLVVDHYALDAQWESAVRPYIEKLMVIDDLADRLHACDLLLDCNVAEDMGNRYDQLAPAHCRRLIGPQYALLRSEFREARIGASRRDGAIRRIAVFFGGSDISNETSKALEAIALMKRPDILVDVIVGRNNPHKRSIEALADGMPNVACHCHVDGIAKLLSAADLYIGAAGITTWERCCLGLPSLVVTVAENQVKIIEYMAKKELLFYIGGSHKVKCADIKNALDYFLRHPERLRQYSNAAFELVDGMGARRCADKMVAFSAVKQALGRGVRNRKSPGVSLCMSQ